MKGYKAWVGRDENNCAFELCRTKQEAEQALKNMEGLRTPDLNEGIVEIGVNECRCGRLTFANMGECLRCEDLRHDAMLDRMAESESEKSGRE